MTMYRSRSYRHDIHIQYMFYITQYVKFIRLVKIVEERRKW